MVTKSRNTISYYYIDLIDLCRIQSNNYKKNYDKIFDKEGNFLESNTNILNVNVTFKKEVTDSSILIKFIYKIKF